MIETPAKIDRDRETQELIKGVEESRKLRGAFFTPPLITNFLVEWAVRTPVDRVLEPSCGEAAFLLSTGCRLRDLGAGQFARDQLRGVDIHEESVASAAALLREHGFEGDLQITDFFNFPALPQFDAVVGNPPYVRYQHYIGEARTRGRQAALAQGVRLDALASSWAAFVVHCAACLKPGGRLALVLPAELLSVNYAGPVRRFLLNRFQTVQLVLFEERVFPGVLEEVVLLLAEGQGPTDSFELYQAKNLSGLTQFETQSWKPAPPEGKWSAALLPAESGRIYTEVLRSGAFSRLDEWGDTTLGMVTGNNRYFALSQQQAQSLELRGGDLKRICPPSSRHLRGMTFTERAWEEMAKNDARVYLFDPNIEKPSRAALAYIRSGEERKVHEAYKCRVRSPWWRVPRVGIPDLFFTYMNHDTPRLVANKARMPYLNSIHGVFLKKGIRKLGSDLLPLAALNSVTLLGAEIVGRSYGGGMLKLEPTEADQLPVPSLESVKAAAPALRALRPQLAKHLRQGDLLGAARLVDRTLLMKELHIRSEQLEMLRRGREHMFGRREARGKLRDE